MLTYFAISIKKINFQSVSLNVVEHCISHQALYIDIFMIYFFHTCTCYLICFKNVFNMEKKIFNIVQFIHALRV